MDYKCSNCDWSGPWDELIHETMCPECRSFTAPAMSYEAHIRKVMQTVYSYKATGAPPQ